ncbi:ABC-2 family transporter protein [Streptomyces tubbatahanensis]|uniref:ABC-2 family transporter protein n=1 Tax=Streptomyces tubbatahanensis TaxID=2923272 RepID=A0ABY3XRW3_9ACTN|nr:ABC-2 family transporter protein [Streptomyces tubbatahanensis]UNS97207.1 ABC-2 family transporter protein [Streptomyces tubbatahanensis]
MHLLRLNLAVAASGFRRYATYRVATAAGVFTNTVFGFILAYTFIALWYERPQLGGYDQSQALTFVWIGQAMLATAALMGGGFQDEFHARVRNGDVAIDLYRPVDLQLWWFASDLGRAAFQLLGRGLVPLAVGAFAFELTLPSSPTVWLLFLCAVFLAVVVSFALRYLFALCGFWLLDATGLSALSTLLSVFFSGMLLPLTVFPGAFGEAVRWLPWAATLQVPADVLLGESGGGGAAGLGFQLAWAVVLLAAGRLLQAAATRKVVVQGG